MSGHTPGPWRTEGARGELGSRCGVYAGSKDKVRPSLRVATCLTERLPADECAANARLASLAPEMLDELRFLADMARQCDTCAGTGHDPGFPTDAEEACKTCGGVGEVLEAEGELGAIRKLIAEARGEP